MTVQQLTQVQRQVGTRLFDRAVTLGLQAAMQELNPRCPPVQIQALVTEIVGSTVLHPFFQE